MSTPRLALPPLDGSLPVLPHFADFQAQHNPSRPMFVFPSLDPTSTDISSLSFLEFVNATHRVAHIIRPGRAGPEGAVVTIIINADTIVYYALTIGLIRAGYIPFLMSPRNSAAAIANMMEKTGSHWVVSQPAFAPLTDEIRSVLPADYDFRLDALPAMTEIYPTLTVSRAPVADVVPEPYPAPLQTPMPSDVVLYLHSSGSTGFPKPIAQTHTTLTHWCTMPVVYEARLRGLQWGGMALPAFHTIGVTHQLLSPLASGQFTAVFTPRAPAPPVVPTPQNTLEAARRTRVNAIASVPMFVEAWAQNEDDIKFLATRKAVIFAGGPLSSASGSKLVAGGVPLFAVYGATEFGAVTRLLDSSDDLPETEPNHSGKTRDDWEWIQFPALCNTRWVPERDGTFELHVLTCPAHQPSVENLPDGERGYATSDLMEPHPTKPGLWRVVGRKDDVIVLGSGEKVVPIPQESHIAGHPFLSGAIMFGRGRLQPGILIEPKPSHVIDPDEEHALAGFRNAIWPRIEEANRQAPAFARIFKEMIIFTDPERPLVRAAKGTIQRKHSLGLYADAVEALYKTVESSADSQGITPLMSWDTPDIQFWLIENAAALNGGKVPVVNGDLFEQGFDSLSATFLRNRIKGTLRGSSDAAAAAASVHVESNFVFTHPTIVALSEAISALVNPSVKAAAISPVEEIRAMIAKYTAILPQSLATTPRSFKEGAVVVLTGTTGSLGAHILAVLLGDARVSRVYAHNRGSGLVDRQKAAFDAARLPVDLANSPKLVLLSGDLMREDFGLQPAVLSEIRSSVTHVIHNAWRVDFNLVLSSFEPHIDAAVRLASLAPGIHFLFTSSVSIAQGWRPAAGRGPVPEEPLGDPALAVGQGYGMSKFVTEQILASAQKLGMRATTLRIGQISGSADVGAWNTSDWVPSFIKSSIALGKLPAFDGVVSWIPMDAVANTTLDVMFSSTPLTVVNVVHPRPVAWPVVAAAIQHELGTNMPLVSLGDWVESLSITAQVASEAQIQKSPGIKLLDYYRSLASLQNEARRAGVAEIEVGGLTVFQTNKVRELSPTLRNLKPLGEKDVHTWIRFWREKKFLG